jgi:hypothetical protein
MKHGLAVLPALAAIAATAPAAAQEADPPPIVVEGEKRQSEEALTDLARDLADNPRSDRPLARFEQPLCLMVAAGNPELGREIAARIIDNAKAAKVRVRSSGCSPNALVSFSDDAQAQLRDIRKSGRRLFAGLSAREIDAAMGARDPVYVFRASRETSATGQEIVASPEARGSDGIPGNQNRVFSMGRTKREVREDVLAALVVVDNGAAAGLSPIQIADYASLRLLAPTGEVDLTDAGGPRTIMTLFAAPANAPAAMTRFDRAYLAALYRMPRGSFAREVLRAAVRDAADPGPDEG